VGAALDPTGHYCPKQVWRTYGDQAASELLFAAPYFDSTTNMEGKGDVDEAKKSQRVILPDSACVVGFPFY